MKTNLLLPILLLLALPIATLAATPPPTPVPFDPVSALVLGAGGLFIGKKMLKKKTE